LDLTLFAAAVHALAAGLRAHLLAFLALSRSSFELALSHLGFAAALAGGSARCSVGIGLPPSLGTFLSALLSGDVEYGTGFVFFRLLQGLALNLFTLLFLSFLTLLTLLLLSRLLTFARLLAGVRAFHCRLKALARLVARFCILSFVLARFFLAFGIAARSIVADLRHL
jgi:hypothetical protein